MIHITRSITILPEFGRRFDEPYDNEVLRGLEQQLDQGDATLEPRPENWGYTHTLETNTGAVWLVYVKED
jgi:hypothetical protein